MKLNYIHCREELKRILEEIKDIVGFSFAMDGVMLEASQDEEEGFQVTKKEQKIMIQYHTKTDFCRAVLMVCSEGDTKEFQQREKAFAKDFGVMLDFSRNAVMHGEAVKQFIRVIALMGYRFLSLYLEDTIVVPEEPYLGYMRGALTGEELKEIEAYAELFGMEVRACIQTLAHLNQITRYEDYNDIIDTGDILLAGEEKTYQFLEHLIKTVSESLKSRKINIGMDEAHMVGLGKYLDQHGFQERSGIMAAHLNRVLDICRKYGLQVQMWSDMFFRLAYGGEYYVEDAPAHMPEIPEDVELVYWDYYSCEKTHYDKMLKNHLKITEHTGFAGGAWKWTGFAPHNGYSVETGKAALEACRENQISSVVITAWGDNGAEASNFSILPALYADAELVYHGKSGWSKFEVLTGIPFEDYMLLDLPNQFSDEKNIHNNASKYLLYNDVLLGVFDSLVFDGVSEFYQEAAKKLEICRNQESYGYLFETQYRLCRLLSHKAAFGKRLKEAYDSRKKELLYKMEKEELPELLEELQLFYEAFRLQWERENKPFGFEIQCIRLGGLQKRLEYAMQQLNEYNCGRKEKIEELEADRKEFHYYHEDSKNDGNINKLNYNLWNQIVSPSVIG